MRALFSVIFLVVVIAVALALGAENGVSVQFNYLLAQDEFHLSSLMVGWFFSGLLIALTISSYLLIRNRLQLRALRKKVAAQAVALRRFEAIAAESPVKD